VVWLFDVEPQTIEVYIPGKPVIILGINDVLNGGNVLPGFKVAVKDIFAAKQEGCDVLPTAKAGGFWLHNAECLLESRSHNDSAFVPTPWHQTMGSLLGVG